jgi:hypothetical protein
MYVHRYGAEELNMQLTSSCSDQALCFLRSTTDTFVTDVVDENELLKPNNKKTVRMIVTLVTCSFRYHKHTC